LQERELAVDFAALTERVGDDEELLKELAQLYLDDETRLLVEIGRALDAADATAVSRSAHTLKGAVSNFCAPRAHAAAQALELAGRDARLGEARALFVSLQAELALVREALTERLR